MADETRRDELSEEERRTELEFKRLQMQLIRQQLNEAKEKEEDRKVRMERQLRELEANKLIEANRQSNCKHRKGGKNLVNFLNGNDSQYSVVRITYPTGDVVIMCTRCQKEYRKPPVELKKSNPSRYRTELQEYKMACELPTDNEPMGTQLFLVREVAA